jgi:hypothetical protein
MVLILGVTNLYLVFDQQFPAYYASQFADPKHGAAMFGYLNSAQIFVEAGMLFVAPFIVNRTGAKNGLLLAAAIMIFRIAGSGLVEGPVAISAMKMLHSLELPILAVSIFRYIAAHFESPPGLDALPGGGQLRPLPGSGRPVADRGQVLRPDRLPPHLSADRPGRRAVLDRLAVRPVADAGQPRTTPTRAQDRPPRRRSGQGRLIHVPSFPVLRSPASR